MRKVFKTCTISDRYRRDLFLCNDYEEHYADYDEDMYMLISKPDDPDYRRQVNLRIHQEARRLP